MVELATWVATAYLSRALHWHLQYIDSKIRVADNLVSIRALKHHYFQVVEIRARIMAGCS